MNGILMSGGKCELQHDKEAGFMNSQPFTLVGGIDIVLCPYHRRRFHEAIAPMPENKAYRLAYAKMASARLNGDYKAIEDFTDDWLSTEEALYDAGVAWAEENGLIDAP